MKIQLNTDRTITGDANTKRFVNGEVKRVLGRFTKNLTRVEVYLSDVNSRKPGPGDKRCLIEARPMRSRPLSTSAKASKVASAVGEALGKMQRLLTTFFGRKERAARATPAAKKAAVKKVAAKKTAKLSPRGPKKKPIYQARRKSWPKAA
jgi:hypothetical protein